MNSVERDYYNGKDIWRNDDSDGADFQIAFGITEIGFADETLPETVGTLKAYYRHWDLTKPKDESVEYRPITTRQCTLEELGLNSPETEEEGTEARRLNDEEAEQSQQFFQPIDEQSRNSVDVYQQQLQCFESKSLALAGNSETLVGVSLVFLIDPCEGTTSGGDACNSDPRSQLKDKSMILYSNQKSLKTNITDTEKVFDTEAKFTWIPLGPEVIENNYFSLTQT